MGLFRLILALMVVAVHSRHFPDSWPNIGIAAVAVFFFVSGFLMPLALISNYTTHGTPSVNGCTRYLISRWLRIYPLYWVTSVVIVVYDGFHGWRLYSEAFETPSIFLKNILLLGLNQKEIWGHSLRFNNPAWTLDIEFQYYLILPLLLLAWAKNREITLSALIIFGLASCFLIAFPLNVFGIDRSIISWGACFIAGFLFFQATSKPECSFWARRAFLLGAAIVALVMVLNPAGYKTLLLTMGLMLMSGHLLVKQQRERPKALDRLLGDLSYPVYISHIFINECVYGNIVHVYMYQAGFAKVFMLNALFSLAAGVILLTLVVYPIDRYRKSLKVPYRESVNLSPLGEGR